MKSVEGVSVRECFLMSLGIQYVNGCCLRKYLNVEAVRFTTLEAVFVYPESCGTGCSRYPVLKVFVCLCVSVCVRVCACVRVGLILFTYTGM